jgi:hypothetical protein
MASVYVTSGGTRVVVRFAEWECWVLVERYQNGRVALRLVDSADHVSIARATVNRPDIRLEADEVLIKDYSENAGILDALERAGVVMRTERTIASGYATLIIACLLVGQATTS